ncbi:MAG TPA: amino acid adenylation domain-containing protein, partial [Longimicrobiaceae bacterium]
DVVVGTPIAGRRWREVEGLVGFFVNTLALRGDLSGDPTFRELVGRVRETTLGAYAHQDFPFEKLVEELAPERDLSRNPLFSVLFALQNAPEEDLELAGIKLTWQWVDSTTAKFDLMLWTHEEKGEIVLLLEYATDLFRASTAERMRGHLVALLDGIVADPDAPLSRLPLLAPAERERILAEWNDTAREVPPSTLHALVEAQAARTPDAVALVFEGERVTYRELGARADALARRLRALGVGPETRVGVCMERSPELVTALLGTLKAGGAYVPLDPSYPAERLAYMLEDSAVPVLLAQEGVRLPEYGGTIVAVDAPARPHPAALEPPPSPTGGGGASPSSPEAQSAEAGPAALTPRPPLPMLGEGEHDSVEGEDRSVEMPLPRDGGGWRARGEPGGGFSPDSLAYVIYTSGSTGRPKGAMNAHRGVVNRLRWMQDRYGLTADDVVLQKTPFSFDVSVWEFFWPLMTGARLVLARPEGHRDPEYLSELIEREGVTTLHFVPSMLQAFLEAGEPERCGSVRRVVCSGEALSPEVAERFHGRLPAAELHNLYGPTEAAVDVTYHACVPGESMVPIGRPVANTRIHILDAWLQEVPVGVPGELYIGGVQVGRGYHGRPELTAERFVPDPFSSTGGERLYRTGDRARWLATGEVEYLGRLDEQVKVRGFRIELGEIEAALLREPGVREAVAAAREDAPGHARIVAYVVADAEGAPSAPALRARLKEVLPDYMVPAAFVFLEALPLSPNGKLDRAALPAPEWTRPEEAGETVAPRDSVEETLAGIWCGVLRLDRVGVHDNFFELGGDSILSIQVISRAAQAGIRLVPRQMFQHQTVAELAAVADTAAVVQAEQGEVTGEAPLTPVQRWFFEQELPEPGHWNQALLLEVRRSVDADALREAVGALLRHHDALRLRFRREGGAWRQSFAPFDGEVLFERVDLTGVPEAEWTAAVERKSAEAQAGLDLAAGPLLRAVYFDRGAERTGRLLLAVHHLAVDGVSWGVLVEDLERACAQLARGGEVRLPPKTTSFRAWAERLAEHALAPELEAEREEWLAAGGEAVAPLPADLPGGENLEAHARTVTLALTEEETHALVHEVPSAYRTQINDALLAGLARALGEWTGSRAVRVELEGHGREPLWEDVDLSRTVGWFTSVFPVTLDPGPDASPGSVLRAAKERLRALPGKGIGYGMLRYLGREETAAALGALPAPEVSFNYLGRMDALIPGSSLFRPVDEPAGPAHAASSPRRYLLEVNASISDGRLRVGWTYSERVHHASTVERLATRYLHHLREIVEHCRAPEAGGYTPSDFPEAGLEQDELDDLVAEFIALNG